MASEKNNVSPRDRITRTAFDLFYRQGYHATGINQIIAESGVAKASFYDHFPSKEDLLMEYAREMAQREADEMRRFAYSLPAGRERFFGVFKMLTPWFEQTGYRGCPFQNLMAESACELPAIKGIAALHRENIRALARELFMAWTEENPELALRDIEDMAATYVILVEGAIATAVAYQANWPVEQAMTVLSRYLGET
ncbi:MAG TPA: TetR/AcrR family transcriptional regulator [Kiritimatiellia bacterium]|nr:TetR/AcrR family transcriptional regulator [Kiritimatiellia bacterium]